MFDDEFTERDELLYLAGGCGEVVAVRAARGRDGFPFWEVRVRFAWGGRERTMVPEVPRGCSDEEAEAQLLDWLGTPN